MVYVKKKAVFQKNKFGALFQDITMIVLQLTRDVKYKIEVLSHAVAI